MLRKRILVLCILVFLISYIFQVKSYTMAKVENLAEISITSSENALIAVPEDLELEVDKHITEFISNELTDAGIQKAGHTILTEYEAISNNFEVINNMNEDIYVEVKMDGNYKGINLTNNSRGLSPGGIFNDINLSLVEDIQEIPESIDVKICAEWQGGSAIIESQINLTVNNIEPLINVSTLDLRTPAIQISPINVEENTLDENTDIIQIENKTDSDIIKDKNLESTDLNINLNDTEQEEMTVESSNSEDNNENLNDLLNNILTEKQSESPQE